MTAREMILAANFGPVEITSANLKTARRIKRTRHIRVRRMVEIGPSHPLVVQHGYSPDWQGYADIADADKARVGDVLVTQAGGIG